MKKILLTTAVVIFAGVLLYSLARIVLTESDYRKAEEIYGQSREQNFHVEDPDPEAPVSNTSEEYFPEVSVDFKTLETENSEVIGWLWIPGTEISFPLLRGVDNSKYLSLSYNLKRTNSGSIFMDYRNSGCFDDSNTVIYGHNMKSGGMFGTLKSYADADFFSEHSYFYVFTAERVYKYRVFACGTTEADSHSFTRIFTDDFSFDDFTAYVKGYSGGNFSEAPEKAVPLVTLSTCTSGSRSSRFVVHAYLAASKSTAAVSVGKVA